MESFAVSQLVSAEAGDGVTKVLTCFTDMFDNIKWNYKLQLLANCCGVRSIKHFWMCCSGNSNPDIFLIYLFLFFTYNCITLFSQMPTMSWIYTASESFMAPLSLRCFLLIRLMFYLVMRLFMTFFFRNTLVHFKMFLLLYIQKWRNNLWRCDERRAVISGLQLEDKLCVRLKKSINDSKTLAVMWMIGLL